MTPHDILARYEAALAARQRHEGIWRDCYNHVLPPIGSGATLFDAIAADAAEQLSASLLAELTPPWSRWFGLAPGRPAQDTDEQQAAAVLEEAAEMLQTHFDGSNFALEMHQAFLDLVITGTGLMLVEEAAPGEASALRFTAIPMQDAVLEEGPSGRLDTVFRALSMNEAALRTRFPGSLPPRHKGDTRDETAHRVIEAIWPDRAGYRRQRAAFPPGRGLS